MQTKRQREKLFHAVIYFAQNTWYCHKLKLIKLLYHLDFEHFKETGRSVTGLEYTAYREGPVPFDLFKSIEPGHNTFEMNEFFYTKNEHFTNKRGRCLHVIPIKDFNEKIFSKRQLELLEEIARKYKAKTSNQMSKSTHGPNSPWSKTMQSQVINYMLALEEGKKSLTKKEVEERQQLDWEAEQLLEQL